jgi:prepilin-type N-terminal cleavage/methylation domain-containing protein
LRHAAFSLVELLAVVGIIAILAVGTVPILRGLGDSQSSRGAAMILVSALEQARSAAILSGTEVYLALPDRTFPNTNYRSNSYVLLRRKLTNSGGPNDDFFTNQSSPWIVLSKWERLPGTLVFGLTSLTNRLLVTNLAIPGNPDWRGQLATISFNPAGSVNADSALRLLFTPSNLVTNQLARFADRVEITRFSGRIRYAGLTNNVTNF